MPALPAAWKMRGKCQHSAIVDLLSLAGSGKTGRGERRRGWGGRIDSILYIVGPLDGRCAVADDICVVALLVSSICHVIYPPHTSHNAPLRIRQSSPWKLRNPPRHPQHSSYKPYSFFSKTFIGIADLRSHPPSCYLSGGSEAPETACGPISSVTI